MSLQNRPALEAWGERLVEVEGDRVCTGGATTFRRGPGDRVCREATGSERTTSAHFGERQPRAGRATAFAPAERPRLRRGLGDRVCSEATGSQRTTFAHFGERQSRVGRATTFAAATMFTGSGDRVCSRATGSPEDIVCAFRRAAARGWEGDRVCSGGGDHVYGEDPGDRVCIAGFSRHRTQRTTFAHFAGIGPSNRALASRALTETAGRSLDPEPRRSAVVPEEAANGPLGSGMRAAPTRLDLRRAT